MPVVSGCRVVVEVIRRVWAGLLRLLEQAGLRASYEERFMDRNGED